MPKTAINAIQILNEETPRQFPFNIETKAKHHPSTKSFKKLNELQKETRKVLFTKITKREIVSIERRLVHRRCLIFQLRDY